MTTTAPGPPDTASSTTEATEDRSGSLVVARADRSRLSIRRLHAGQLAVIAVVALSLPAGAVAVFGFDADRGTTADVIGTVFFASIVVLLTSAWWPLPSLRERTRFERVQSMCFLWFGLTVATHLTWELAWLLLHDAIVSSPDAPWAYAWWMYIDGGDLRYASSNPTLITQEILSVVNGLVGATGLLIWWRTRGRSMTATLLLMAMAVVHLYSTCMYFGTEIFDGLPNVDTGSVVDLWIKFALLNGIWLVMPWFVLWWGVRTLRRQAAEQLVPVVHPGGSGG